MRKQILNSLSALMLCVCAVLIFKPGWFMPEESDYYYSDAGIREHLELWTDALLKECPKKFNSARKLYIAEDTSEDDRIRFETLFILTSLLTRNAIESGANPADANLAAVRTICNGFIRYIKEFDRRHKKTHTTYIRPTETTPWGSFLCWSFFSRGFIFRGLISKDGENF